MILVHQTNALEQCTAHRIQRFAPGMVEPKAVAFEHATPSQPLGARQLMDAVTRSHQFIEDFGHGTGPRSSARVTGVLIQEAVRYENNAATAFVV